MANPETSPEISKLNDLVTALKREEKRNQVLNREPSFVISSLPRFALNDILHLLISYPKLVYEIDTLVDQDDMVHYLTSIRKICPKSSSCLNITEDFLEEFKNKKIRDYIFDFLVTFTYFRIENVVYEVTDELTKQFKHFFTCLETEFSYPALEFNKLNEKFPPDIKFYVFKNPEKDLIDIRILETYLKNNPK